MKRGACINVKLLKVNKLGVLIRSEGWEKIEEVRRGRGDVYLASESSLAESLKF